MAQLIYRGNTYPVIDPIEWHLGEASFIKRQTGQAVGEIGANAARSDAEAIVALLYVAKKRAGEKVRWDDFKEFTVSEVDFVPDDDPRAQGASDSGDDESGDGEGGADPTSPTGTTRASGSSTTSNRSRSTTGSTRGKSKS